MRHAAPSPVRVAQVLRNHGCSARVLQGGVVLVGYQGRNHLLRIGDPADEDEGALWVRVWRGEWGQARSIEDALTLVGLAHMWR